MRRLWNIIFDNPPKFLKNYWVNSGIAVILMWILAYTNAFSSLWPIFGSANQLLAALAMFTVTIWLFVRGKKYAFALAPAIFMMVTTIGSLFILMKKYIVTRNYILMTTDILLLALSVSVIILMATKVSRKGRAQLMRDAAK